MCMLCMLHVMWCAPAAVRVATAVLYPCCRVAAAHVHRYVQCACACQDTGTHQLLLVKAGPVHQPLHARALLRHLLDRLRRGRLLLVLALGRHEGALVLVSPGTLAAVKYPWWLAYFSVQFTTPVKLFSSCKSVHTTVTTSSGKPAKDASRQGSDLGEKRSVGSPNVDSATVCRYLLTYLDKIR